MPSRVAVTHDEWASLPGGQPSSASTTSGAAENNASSSRMAAASSAPTAGASTTTTTTKRTRKKKDPNAPKHPVSAYLFFSMDIRPTLQAEGIPATGAKIGELYRGLSAERRAHYDALAAEDSRRYYREMTRYNTTKLLGQRASTVTPPPNPLVAAAAAASATAAPAAPSAALTYVDCNGTATTGKYIV